MRRIIVALSVSLDGYFEGPGGDLSWHRVDDELHRHFMPGVFDAGRRAQEQAAAFLRARIGLTPAGSTAGTAAGGPDHG
ncbi:hypothetical protein [Micromonospora sp. NPDC005299]|uniref:hypothetical protein n=1 Tax=Micromonospora sp. NPDC005299 TaxID=3364231 RepID=UPI0036B8E74B